MRYYQHISRQLAAQRVYWNANYKVYMALRHVNVQAQVEKYWTLLHFS
jgi:hypothetical protein